MLSVPQLAASALEVTEAARAAQEAKAARAAQHVSGPVREGEPAREGPQ